VREKENICMSIRMYERQRMRRNEKGREECGIEGPCGSVIDVMREIFYWERTLFVLTTDGKLTRYSYNVT